MVGGTINRKNLKIALYKLRSLRFCDLLMELFVYDTLEGNEVVIIFDLLIKDLYMIILTRYASLLLTTLAVGGSILGSQAPAVNAGQANPAPAAPIAMPAATQVALGWINSVASRVGGNLGVTAPAAAQPGPQAAPVAQPAQPQPIAQLLAQIPAAININTPADFQGWIDGMRNPALATLRGQSNFVRAPVLAMIDSQTQLLHRIFTEASRDPQELARFNVFINSVDSMYQNITRDVDTYSTMPEQNRINFAFNMSQRIAPVLAAAQTMQVSDELKTALINQLTALSQGGAGSLLALMHDPLSTQELFQSIRDLQTGQAAGVRNLVTDRVAAAGALNVFHVNLTPQQIAQARQDIDAGQRVQVVNQYAAQLAQVASNMGVTLTQEEVTQINQGGLIDQAGQATNLATTLAQRLNQSGLALQPQEIARMAQQGITRNDLNQVARRSALNSQVGGMAGLIPGLQGAMGGARPQNPNFPINEPKIAGLSAQDAQLAKNEVDNARQRGETILLNFGIQELQAAAYYGDMGKLKRFTKKFPNLLETELDGSHATALVYAAWGYHGGNASAEEAFIHLLKSNANSVLTIDTNQVTNTGIETSTSLENWLKVKDQDPMKAARRERLALILAEHRANPQGIIVPAPIVSSSGFSWKKWLAIGAGTAVGVGLIALVIKKRAAQAAATPNSRTTTAQTPTASQ